MIEFNPFPKMPRLSRGMVITEKIDGTNASVHIRPAEGNVLLFGTDTQVDIDGAPHYIRAGSRTRWISVEDDNYGFAAWVYQHAPDLARLGPGHHFGEWWGRGIQRNYGQTERHFSLFNTGRWVQYEGNVTTDTPQQTFSPKCCRVVPVLYTGPFEQSAIEEALWRLKTAGSAAAIGFMDAEGVVVYHAASGMSFKKTIKNDEAPKSQKGKQHAAAV